MKLAATLLLIFLSISLSAIEPYYHSVKANKGDGIYSLLRRYQLNDHKCNREEFLKLNSLSLKDQLNAGKAYKLPIKIYEYNGKSIRSTIGTQDYKQALRIKEYNEMILSEKLRKTNYIDSKILWVPHHEIYCNGENQVSIKAEVKDLSTTNSKSKIPAAVKIDEAKYEIEPLFGKGNQKIKIESDKLKNQVYYIVSGHGGIDPGAMCTDCKTTLCEDEYAYDVSLRLARKLISHGATTHIIIQDKNDGIRSEQILTCDKDETVMGKKITGRQLYRLRHRAGAVNHLYMDHKKNGVKRQAAIMIHVDSNTKDKRMDAYFFHHKTSKSSKALAEAMRDKFKEKYDYYQKDRGYKGFVRDCNLFMINNTYPTSVLVELANIKNKNDQKRLIKPQNRELLAQWMYEGIIEAKI